MTTSIAALRPVSSNCIPVWSAPTSESTYGMSSEQVGKTAQNGANAFTSAAAPPAGLAVSATSSSVLSEAPTETSRSPSKRPRLDVKEEEVAAEPAHPGACNVIAAQLPSADEHGEQRPVVSEAVTSDTITEARDAHQRVLQVDSAVAALQGIFEADAQRLQGLRRSYATLADRCRFHEATIKQMKWEAEEGAAREAQATETISGLEDMVRQLEARLRERNKTVMGLEAERDALLVLLGEKDRIEA